MFRTSISIALCAAILLTGCRVNPAPTVVSRFGAGNRAVVHKAAYAGEYRLLPAQLLNGRLQPQETAIAVRTLERGQRLGFLQPRGEGYNGGATTVAVAGDESFPLQEGAAYVWEMRATPGQIDAGKTIVLALVIAATVGIVVGSLSTFELGTTGAFYP